MHDAVKNTEKCVLKQLALNFQSEGRYVHIITYRPVTEKLKRMMSPIVQLWAI